MSGSREYDQAFDVGYEIQSTIEDIKMQCGELASPGTRRNGLSVLRKIGRSIALSAGITGREVRQIVGEKQCLPDAMSYIIDAMSQDEIDAIRQDDKHADGLWNKLLQLEAESKSMCVFPGPDQVLDLIDDEAEQEPNDDSEDEDNDDDEEDCEEGSEPAYGESRPGNQEGVQREGDMQNPIIVWSLNLPFAGKEKTNPECDTKGHLVYTSGVPEKYLEYAGSGNRSSRKCIPPSFSLFDVFCFFFHTSQAMWSAESALFVSPKVASIQLELNENVNLLPWRLCHSSRASKPEYSGQIPLGRAE